jgi:hypothetical protein
MFDVQLSLDQVFSVIYGSGQVKSHKSTAAGLKPEHVKPETHDH